MAGPMTTWTWPSAEAAARLRHLHSSDSTERYRPQVIERVLDWVERRTKPLDANSPAIISDSDVGADVDDVGVLPAEELKQLLNVSRSVRRQRSEVIVVVRRAEGHLLIKQVQCSDQARSLLARVAPSAFAVGH